MNFHKGDTVMHWTYGIGQIVNLEERALAGSKTIYYVVQVRDMTVWVPADNKVRSRLRSPTPKPHFQRLLAILSSPSEPLPEDRLERKTRLLELLEDGRPPLRNRDTGDPCRHHGRAVLRRQPVV